MISVLINGVICPTVGEDSILVTKKIVDIENPDQKQIDYSKGFLIQDTAATRLLFGQIFEVNLDIQNVSEVNFTPDFNPNLKAKCVILNDNAVVLNGYCQMLDITIDKDRLIRYNINAYAAIGNFFNDIKNKTLNDIDFSDLSHPWTKASVEDGFTPILGFGYCYPMIDYGLTTDYNNWLTIYFRPAVFVKDILDRIFTAAGWDYSSAFLISTRFKSLIIPYSAENVFIDNTEILDRSFLVGRNTSMLTQTLPDYTLWYNASPIIFNDDSGLMGVYSLYNTSGNDFNTTTGKWTSTVSGNYKFGITLTCRLVNSTGVTALTGEVVIALVKKVGSVYSIIDTLLVDFLFAGTTSNSTSGSMTTASVSINTGDELYWAAIQGRIDTSIGQIDSNGSNMSIEIDHTVSAFSLIPQSNLVYGDTIDMNSALPNDIKQADFILGLAKMFNLYFDQTSEKTLLIEPREDYFTSDTEDWTQLIDIGNESFPPKLTPMGMNQQKRYKFTYETDGDWLNKRYLESYQQVYGTKLEDITTDFLTETKEIKPIFASTPLFGVMGGTNDRVISSILFADEDGTNIKAGQSKIRILYWGGLIDCNNWTFYETAGVGASTETQYPYAGHLDNPFTPAFDLCYSPPTAVYYDGNIGASGNMTYSDANLYTEYWYRTIKEFTNKNSKVLEAMFNISIYRYLTLSFRKQYFIKEAYYRLISIEDYNLNGLEKVKCKLLKVDRQAAYVTSSKILRGGNGTFDTGGNLPTLNYPPNKDSGVVRIDRKYTGEGGVNTGSDTVNRGSGNIIPFGSNKSYIYGSDNVTLLHGNAFVFNSDGATIVRSGAMFNGVDLERKFETTQDETFIQVIDGGTATLILPTVATNEHYEMTKFYLSIEGGTTSYTAVGAGDLILKTNSGTTVGTIAGADWLGEAAGVIAVGTVAANADFGDYITIEMFGTYSTGNRDLRFVIFYKIITV